MPSAHAHYKPIVDLPRNHYPVKVLQFGNGNFLRGFADWMIQEANQKVGFDAGVAVVQSVSTDTTLKEQEGVYTVILKGIRDAEFIREHVTIDVIQRVVFPSLDYHAFLDEGLNPDLHIIISNTTEAGIQFQATDDHIDKPAQSFPGKLAQLLYHRFTHDLNANLLILPTELIDQNGAVLKSIILKYAELWRLPPGFSQWLNTNITFCNTLVDRIVSGFPKKPRETVFEDLGYKDELVVEAEWFHLWVIEGPRWINEVLPFKQAGFNVVITNDLSSYRVRKVRILNGAHTCMAIMGSLIGLQTVRNALEHAHLGKFIRRLIYEEIVPHIPGDILDLEKYADDVITRLRNPAIEHKLEHIAQNSLSKYKVRVLPSIIDNLERNGHVPERLAFTFASLLFFYRSHGEKTYIIHDTSEMRPLLDKAWSQCDSSESEMEKLCTDFLSSNFWEVKITKYPHLIKKVSQLLYSITSKGMLETLKSL